MSRHGQAADIRACLQRAAGDAAAHDSDPHRVAAAGLTGEARALPHRDAIQASFGTHDISNVQAHVGGPAADASAALGARAYATGRQVAFAEQPDLHTAAHEAAHVVQQRGGVQLAGDVGEAGDRYEQHADEVADRVVRGESAQDLLDPVAGGSGGAESVQACAATPAIQLKTALGDMTFQQGTHGRSGTVTVHARSVDEWKAFLANDADGSVGGDELNTFMARAVGQTRLTGLPRFVNTDISQVEAPSETQAVDLMIAFLTVGESIDLPEKLGEGSNVSDYVQGPLMAAFNGRFGAKAIVRLSAEKGEMGRGDFDAVKAYAEDAGDMKDVADDHEVGRGLFSDGTADPNQRLIASALGGAVGGAQKVLAAGDDPARNREKAAGYDLVSNGARIIAACLEQLREDQATEKAVIMTVFKSAVGAAGALTGGTATVLIGVLSPVAEEFLGACLGGDGQAAARKLADDFSQAIDAAIRDHDMDADDARTVKNTFLLGLEY